MREYKVTVTETVQHQLWILAEDPHEAVAIAEKTFSPADMAEIEFDVDPAEWRNIEP
jgi:hypothetical protein